MFGKDDLVIFTKVKNKPKLTRQDGTKNPKEPTVINSFQLLNDYSYKKMYAEWRVFITGSVFLNMTFFIIFRKKFFLDHFFRGSHIVILHRVLGSKRARKYR